MTTDIREEALKRLEELQHSTDTEGAHVKADDVLTDLLWALGYDEVVMAYSRIDKWYA